MTRLANIIIALAPVLLGVPALALVAVPFIVRRRAQ